jgi:hypothetical protein
MQSTPKGHNVAMKINRANSSGLLVASIITIGWLAANARAVPIMNAGFEDVSGQSPFNEFTFGEPAGWDFYDPSGIVNSAGIYTGTLQPNGTDFFNTIAPEGVKVSILFNASREGEGAYGYVQTLADTLQANTEYALTVEVGNIASGTAQNGTFFNLDEFPGYRVDLLAGGIVIAQDDNSLAIPEGEFATSTVSIHVGATHPQMGQNLGIRLVNLNVLPDGYTQATSPDLEVDFDDVALSATPVTFSPGDIDRNGIVDRADAAQLARHMGSMDGTWETGDFDNNGATGLTDLALLQTNLSATELPEVSRAAVPEPATQALAALALVWGAVMRHRHRSPQIAVGTAVAGAPTAITASLCREGVSAGCCQKQRFLTRMALS